MTIVYSKLNTIYILLLTFELSRAKNTQKAIFYLYMGFRENLKEELTYQDITVKELSLKTGISKHTIDHYLTKNGSQPQAEIAVKIAQALNVSVEYLVLGKDMKPSKSQRNIKELTKKIISLSDRDYDFIKRIVNKL